jgi:hypothetical protein
MTTTILQAGPAATPRPGTILNSLSQKDWLLPAVLACALAAPLSALEGSSYQAVLSYDK